MEGADQWTALKELQLGFQAAVHALHYSSRSSIAGMPADNVPTPSARRVPSPVKAASCPATKWR